MAIPVSLQQFSASGVYRLTFDKSQTSNIPADQIRLVVGFSKKGPQNTPILINDPSFFIQVFGDIDRNLEEKGAYFHRTALQCLEAGPILALNLLRTDDDNSDGSADEVEYQALSTSATKINPDEKNALYSGFYNTDKFWFPETDSTLNNIGDTNKEIIQFVNLKQKPVSIMVRKAQPKDISSFNITAKDWYGSANVPEWMRESDYISDYFVEVTIIDGDFTNYSDLSLDPTFGQYFNETKGLTKSTLDQFLSIGEINVLGKYVGALIPDFVDLNGNELFIQDIINQETSITGVFSAVDVSAFDDEIISGVKDGVDIIGHNLEYETNNNPDFNKIEFLSYQKNIKNDLAYPTNETSEILIDSNTGVTYKIAGGSGQSSPVSVGSNDVAPAGSGQANYIIEIDDTNPDFNTIKDKLRENQVGDLNRFTGSYIVFTDGQSSPTQKYAPIVDVTNDTALVTIGISVEESGWEAYTDSASVPNLVFIEQPVSFVHDPSGANGIFKAEYGSNVYSDYSDGLITSGDQVKIAAESNNFFLNFSKVKKFNIDTGGSNDGLGIIGENYYFVPSLDVKAYETSDFDTQEDLVAPGTDIYEDSTGTTLDNFNVISLEGNLNEVIDILSNGLPNNQFEFSKSTYGSNKVEKGDFILSNEVGPNGESRLTRVKNITETQSSIKVECYNNVQKTDVNGQLQVELYNPIESIITHYKLFSLNGFTLDKNYHIPNGTQARQDLILSETIGSNTGLRRGLTDRDVIDFRYLVDSFGLGIQSSSKSVYTDLCNDRKNATAIINAPSIKDFKESTNPSFTNQKGQVVTSYIADGGDLTKNPDTLYTLPSVGQGSNKGFYYTPYLTIRERNRNVNVPPAGYVSNLFINKYTDANPWSVVAGPRRGVIAGTSVVGLETNFDRTDREELEPFGLNPIIFQRGVGITISANKTAQQNVNSALSSIDNVEALIYIQDGIAEILKDYQFEQNTPQVRLEILSLADDFMDQVLDGGAIAAYQNIMDTTNNTPEVIRENYGILDTRITFTGNLEIIVHRTTIYRTGVDISG